MMTFNAVTPFPRHSCGNGNPELSFQQGKTLHISRHCPIVTNDTPAMPLNDAHSGGFFCGLVGEVRG